MTSSTGDRPAATVSVDVDPLDLHLAGYGVAPAERDLKVYAVAIPRLIAAFGERGIRATFFFLARDLDRAEARRAAVSAVAAGHEVASHSIQHSIPFRKLPPHALRDELYASKARIEAATGVPVAGFRAPNWDLSLRELPLLVRAGYRYDASAYPSPFLTIARIAVALRGGGLQTITQLKLSPFCWRRLPFVVETADGPIVEFPVATRAASRFPIYHTTCYRLGGQRFASIAAGAARRRESFIYTLHGADALALGADALDPRLARHPGMELLLAEKLARLRRILATISAAFRCVTFREHCSLVRAEAPDK